MGAMRTGAAVLIPCDGEFECRARILTEDFHMQRRDHRYWFNADDFIRPMRCADRLQIGPFYLVNIETGNFRWSLTLGGMLISEFVVEHMDLDYCILRYLCRRLRCSPTS